MDNIYSLGDTPIAPIYTTPIIPTPFILPLLPLPLDLLTVPNGRSGHRMMIFRDNIYSLGDTPLPLFAPPPLSTLHPHYNYPLPLL